MFCEDPLWDANLTWYTDNPDFTTCFHQTVLVYVPLALLIVLGAFEFNYARKSKDRQIPWTPLNITKLVINIALIVLVVIDFIYEVSNQVASVHVVSSVCKLATYLLSQLIWATCKRRGLVTSSALFYFWTVALLFGGVTFRSVILSQQVFGPVWPFSTYLIQYPLVVVMFFLNCFADARPLKVDIDGETNWMQ